MTYPTGGRRRTWPSALQDTAQLIKADVGTEVVAIDYGSWDMHSNYGTIAWGSMQQHSAGSPALVSAFIDRPRLRCAAGSPS